MNTIESLNDAVLWSTSLRTLPAPHALQTWEWGAFKVRHGWEARRYLWRHQDTPAAAAQLLIQRRGRHGLGYIPKGPTLDWKNPEQVETTLNALEDLARQESLLLLKIDPDVRADTVTGETVREILQRRGWRSSFEQIQFRNTMLLDLRPELDAIMLNMKPKWRYNIRLAARKGVEIRETTVDALPLLYKMYTETARRDDFIIRDANYYQDAWRTFIDAGMATPLVAEVEGTPVAMLILFHFGEWAWYMYGASRDLHRQLMPNHLLQWEAIRRAKALHCTTYDLWGAPDKLDEHDPLWGVYRFKVGFGAEFVPHIGAYDFAPHLYLYRIYASLRPHLVALAQRRYWATQKD